MAKSLEEIALDLNLSVVCSEPFPKIVPPTPGIKDSKPWPCIAYQVQLKRKDQVIWQGEYKLGIGHVDPKKTLGMGRWSLTEDEYYLYQNWRDNPHAEFKNMQVHVQVAVKLAQRQKVAPKVEGVLYSLLQDGACRIDHQTFEEWCANLGYSNDSRHAEQVFRTCEETGRQLMKAFSKEELDQLREAAQDY